MNRRRLLVTLLGFAGAVGIFAGVFWLVGFGQIISTIRRAQTALVGLMIGVICVWLVVWSLGFRTILSGIGIPVSVPKAVGVFAAAMFANNVTPFGQAGGEPVTAAILKGASDAKYESGLAAIASFDTLNFITGITLSIVGLGFYVGALSKRGRFVIVASVIAGIGLFGLPTLLYLAWRRRETLEQWAVENGVPIVQRIASVVPRISPPESDTIERNIREFVADIERVGTNRRRIAITFGFTTAGWLLHSVALWLALHSLGASISLLVLFFVLPIGNVADVLPVPGGLGAVSAVFIGLLVSLGVDPATAAGGVVMYRGVVYWLPVILGGAVTATVGVDTLF
ncbi:MAG TPA: lysylphosphatidylglycerol synthase transmembrane domain-containing protein [Halococcus sp.]|nr:lysylphosphatidylglycerol synthase transmembrane domain-containing protein [Halococcus sp.]